MKELNEREKRYLAVLNYGYGNAVTSDQLAKQFKTTVRNVREILREMCLKGVPIVALRRGNKRGYFLAESVAELHEGIRPLESEVRETKKRVTVLKGLKEYDLHEVRKFKKELTRND